ncbi:MAG: hypothetical protein ACM3H7_05810, partial [Acidobacteriaceae bacterium]
FPSAWMSHYNPSPQHYSLVYYVNLFYKFFIPAVLGSMVALVGLDVGHSLYVRYRPKKQPPQAQAEGTHPSPETQAADDPMASEANQEQDVTPSSDHDHLEAPHD